MSDDKPEIPPGSTGLHPVIYWIIIGLCVWLVASVCGFVGHGYTGLALTVVSLFIAVAVGIPVLLWRIWRHGAGRPQESDETAPVTDWLAGDW